MIELYLSIAKKLHEIPGLALVDIEGTNEAKLYPAAFISLGDLPYEQLGGGTAIASFPFQVKIELSPKHRSGSNSPVLDALLESFSVVADARNKLTKEDVDYIGGIMLTGESLKKKDGKYEAVLKFIGNVEYSPD